MIGGAAYYEFIVRNGQDIQNLLNSIPGGAGASSGSTCQGKDASGNACACPSSSVAYAYPVYSYKSSKKKSSHKSSSKSKSSKSSGGGGGGGGGGSTSSSSPSSTSTGGGTCDCSACTGTGGGGGGGTTGVGTSSPSGGGIWGQNPASKIPCDLPGQSCPTIGALGGTSNWCKCVAGSGAGATAKSINKKTNTVTGGVATVEGYVGSTIANMGLPDTLLENGRIW